MYYPHLPTMEPQQQQLQQLQNQEDMNGNGNSSSGKGGGTSSSSSSYVCRQSSTRWTPTTDQIRILKDLYYNYGVRSPTADQIQRISARLRQYGKIEGKNVFYWFQNHKARERQKKRFFSPDPNSNINGAVPPPPPPPTASAVNTKTRCGGRGSGSWGGKLPPPEDPFVPHNKNSNLTPTGLCSSSAAAAGAMAVGQMGGSYGYGSMTMEKNFRDCSISAAGGGGYVGPNLGWIAVDAYASPPCARKSHPFLENRQEEDEEGGGEEEEEEEGDEEAPELETLPLFPMHGNDHLNQLNMDNTLCNIKPNSDHYHHHIHRQGYWYDDVVMSTSRTSLELSLNSYAGRSPGPI